MFTTGRSSHRKRTEVCRRCPRLCYRESCWSRRLRSRWWCRRSPVSGARRRPKSIPDKLTVAFPNSAHQRHQKPECRPSNRSRQKPSILIQAWRLNTAARAQPGNVFDPEFGSCRICVRVHQSIARACSADSNALAPAALGGNHKLVTSGVVDRSPTAGGSAAYTIAVRIGVGGIDRRILHLNNQQKIAGRDRSARTGGGADGNRSCSGRSTCVPG